MSFAQHRSNSVYASRGVCAPSFGKGQNISSLLSRFEKESIPGDKLVDSVVKGNNSFSHAENRSKRKSLTISKWNDNAAIKGISNEDIILSEKIVTNEITNKEPPVKSGTNANYIPPEEVTRLEDRKKAFLSSHRPVESKTVAVLPSKPVKDIIKKMESDSDLTTKKNSSRSRRVRKSRCFSNASDKTVKIEVQKSKEAVNVNLASNNLPEDSNTKINNKDIDQNESDVNVKETKETFVVEENKLSDNEIKDVCDKNNDVVDKIDVSKSVESEIKTEKAADDRKELNEKENKEEVTEPENTQESEKDTTVENNKVDSESEKIKSEDVTVSEPVKEITSVETEIKKENEINNVSDKTMEPENITVIENDKTSLMENENKKEIETDKESDNKIESENVTVTETKEDTLPVENETQKENETEIISDKTKESENVTVTETEKDTPTSVENEIKKENETETEGENKKSNVIEEINESNNSPKMLNDTIDNVEQENKEENKEQETPDIPSSEPKNISNEFQSSNDDVPIVKELVNINLDNSSSIAEEIDLLEGTNTDTTPIQDNLTIEGVLELLEQGIQLQPSLELMNQGIDDEDLNLLLDKLESSGQINNIERLLLNGNDFESEGGQRIASIISKNYNLLYIDLSWNLIGVDGVTAIAEALNNNTKLKVLILDGNDLQIDGAVAFAEKISTNSTLIQLDIKDNAIGDTGAACLAFSLRKHPSLEILDLTCNGITVDSIEQISKYLIADPDDNPGNDSTYNLKTLVLNCNQLGDEGSFFLSDSLPHAKTLKSIQLKECGIYSDGIIAIAECLLDAESISITDIDLNQNYNTVESEILLNDLLMTHENLYVEWKDPQTEGIWDAEDIQVIISHYGFAQILGNILHGLSLSPLIENHTLLGYIDIEDINVARTFLEEAFSEELFESGLDTVTSMIRRGLPAAEADDFDDFEGEDLYLDENDEELEDLPPLIQIINEWLPTLVEYLGGNNELVQTSSGEIEYFGTRRLKILGLIIALMDEEGAIAISEHLIELSVPTIILNLMLKYPRHTILHKQIQVFLRVSLRTETLRISLFEETCILDFILHCCENEWSKDLPDRSGFSGFLALIIEDILTFEFDDTVFGFLDEHPKFNHFLENEYVQYKEEATSQFTHPKYD